MRQLLITLFILGFISSFHAKAKSAAQSLEFSGLLRRYLVSLTPDDVKFIHQGSNNGAKPNFNWSLPYGPSPVCTLDEVRSIRDALGFNAFNSYGEYINFGWLYDQQEFEYSLRKFLVILKKDKSSQAQVLQAIVENALRPESISQQKSLIQYEIEKNEKRLAEKAGISRDKAKELASGFARRFNGCLGRYQTGYVNFTLHITNH
jgi:hypothetical protein